MKKPTNNKLFLNTFSAFNYVKDLPNINYHLFEDPPVEPPVEPPPAEDPTFGFKGPGGIVYDFPETIKIGDNNLNVKELFGYIAGVSHKQAKLKFDQKTEQIKKDLNDRFNPLMEQISAKDSTLKDLQEEVTKLKDANLTVEEQAQRKLERDTKALNDAKVSAEELATSNWALFENTKIQNDILSGLSGHDLCSIEQVSRLLRQDGNAKLVKDEKSGKYSTELYLKIDGVDETLSSSEAAKKYLALPENAHHLKNNLRPGGGTPPRGSVDANGVTQYTRAQLDDPAINTEYLKKIEAQEKIKIID